MIFSIEGCCVPKSVQAFLDIGELEKMNRQESTERNKMDNNDLDDDDNQVELQSDIESNK